MLIADLHIHSKYSRATSRDCTPEFLDLWARRKGIGLLGTGDFTHPAWRQALKEKLVAAEEGFYRLRDELIQPDATPGAVQPRFVVSGEISSIYKKNGKTRKVHNVIILPGLEEAELLSQKLEAIGNIHSDGRPILGLDSRDLLEITLESCPRAIFIPAHIWTPHFSLFGAFSGFDTIEECFEDLTGHIHALETGLSSDPAMNARVGALDRFALVSNSDAHSPAKLGREANLLNIDMTYSALYAALQGENPQGLAGTIEFFPEEGKYHLDGHRACKLCLTPAETQRYGGRCPVCGKKLTIGVQHRVEQLADRPEGYCRPDARHYESLVPLPEVIAASTGLSAGSVKVARQYQAILQALGPEFYILREATIEQIARTAGPCVAEGIRRLRRGEVRRKAGYDGEYGVIGLLDPSEIETLNGQLTLLEGWAPPAAQPAQKAPLPPVPPGAQTAPVEREAPLADAALGDEDHPLLSGLNPEQREAVTSTVPALAVIAGPGTGKTKTLVSRIAYLISERKVKPSEITAVTFTNKAAAEMRQRLEQALGGKRALRGTSIGTFHALCLEYLRETGGVTLLDEEGARRHAAAVIQARNLRLTPEAFLRAVSIRKNGGEDDGLSDEAFALYCDRLKKSGAADFDDLLADTLAAWVEGRVDARWRRRFNYLLVDEFQDINPIQYRLIRAWAQEGKSLFAIGDPDQSIYGFRGADAACFKRLQEDWPALCTIHLRQNYRSTPQVLRVALPLISHNPGQARELLPHRPDGAPVGRVAVKTDLSEGIFIAKQIGQMVGGLDMLESGALAAPADRAQGYGFSDFAILYRTHRQAEMLEKCLRQEGIPYVVSGREDDLSSEDVCGVLGFFRFLADPQDTLSLTRALKVLFGCPEALSESFAALWEGAGHQMLTPTLLEERAAAYLGAAHVGPLIEAAGAFLPRMKKEKPRKLIEALCTACGLKLTPALEHLLGRAVFHTEMAAFLDNLALGQEADLERSTGHAYSAGAVRLMTLHGAKGLEFPVVFLCGVKKGMIPLETPYRPADMEEERRLFYVGITRAKDSLYLCTGPEASTFMQEIPAADLKPIRANPNAAQGAQLSLFGRG